MLVWKTGSWSRKCTRYQIDEEKNVHIVHDSLRARMEKKGPISYTDYDDDQTDDDQDKLEEPCPGAKTVVIRVRLPQRRTKIPVTAKPP